jgi:Tyrosine-protein kinase ephrin type A/B receptor-like
LACPNGYHSPGGTEICIQCPKGTKGPDNNPAAPCTKCAPGTYNNKIGSETCSKCPAGTSSGTGASKCTDCPRGKISKAGQLCADCPEGTYAKVTGSSKCLTCNAPAGSQKGAYRCNKCAAGSSATGDNAICKPCPANFYSAARFAEDCTRCPPLYTSGPGSSGCTAYL